MTCPHRSIHSEAENFYEIYSTDWSIFIRHYARNKTVNIVWLESHLEPLNFGPPHHGEGRNTPSPAWPACLHMPEPLTRLLQTPRLSVPEDYYRASYKL